MSMTRTLEECPYLPISEGNRIVRDDNKSSETMRHGVDKNNDYYDEVTSDGTVVAKYYSWSHVNMYPPQNSKEGWIKYNLHDERIDSGDQYIE
jgi:hypothetical protein